MKLLARLLIFGEYFFLFESIKSSAGPIIAEVPQKNRQQSELNIKTFMKFIQDLNGH